MTHIVSETRVDQAVAVGLSTAPVVTSQSLRQFASVDRFGRFEGSVEAEDPRSGISARPVLWRDRNGWPTRVCGLVLLTPIAGAGAAFVWGNTLRLTHASVWARTLGDADVSERISRLYIGGSALCGASIAGYEIIRSHPQVSHQHEDRERAMQAQTLRAVTGGLFGALLGAIVVNGLQQAISGPTEESPSTQAVVLRLIVAIVGATTVSISCFKMNRAGQPARRSIRSIQQSEEFF